MTTIDPNQRIAAALQQQLGALRDRARAQGTRAPAGPSRAVAQRLSPATVHRLAHIDPADPDRHRKAARLYLEGELAREFGDGLLNDPAFPQMVDAVQEQMERDAEVAAAVRALGRWLVEGRGRGRGGG